MPLLENEALIKAFLEHMKRKNPNFNLTFPELALIIKTPFKFIRQNLSLPTMPTVHIKFLGKFIVYKGKIKNIMKNAHERFLNGNYKEDKYTKFADQSFSKLNDIEDEQLSKEAKAGYKRPSSYL